MNLSELAQSSHAVLPVYRRSTCCIRSGLRLCCATRLLSSAVRQVHGLEAVCRGAGVLLVQVPDPNASVHGDNDRGGDYVSLSLGIALAFRRSHASSTPAPVVATESTTVTVIVTPVCGAAQKRQAKPPAGPFAHLLSDLQKQPPPIIQKLCSCIETTPPCTTSTLTVNTATTLAPATVTTTVTLSATVTAACTPYQGCTYSGTVCSTTDYCTSDESCFCQLDAVGGSVCVPAGQPCPSQSCSANADCGPGAACYVSTCCGYNACFSTNQGTCPNAARPSRMFRAREAGRRTTAAMAGVVGREPSSRMNSPSPPGQ